MHKNPHAMLCVTCMKILTIFAVNIFSTLQIKSHSQAAAWWNGCTWDYSLEWLYAIHCKKVKCYVQLHNNAVTWHARSLEPIVTKTHSKPKRIDQFREFVV